MTPDTEILVLEHPQFQSARLLHTLRWLARRDGVGVEVWDEETAFHTVYESPETLLGVLIHVPPGLFPDSSQLREQLRVAGVHWNYLPPLPPRQAHHGTAEVTAWETLLTPGALSQWLARGTPEPWQAPPPHVRDPKWCRIPTINASEVPRWH